MILAGNHLSFIDPVALAALVRRRVRFLAASNYFTKRGPGRLVSWFLAGTGGSSGNGSGAAALGAGEHHGELPPGPLLAQADDAPTNGVAHGERGGASDNW